MAKASYYNVGPDDCDCVTTGNLVGLFCDKWNASSPDDGLPTATWIDKAEKNAPHGAKIDELS